MIPALKDIGAPGGKAAWGPYASCGRGPGSVRSSWGTGDGPDRDGGGDALSPEAGLKWSSPWNSVMVPQ